MKKHTDSQHIFHLKNEGTGCYGIMLKQRDYYIYAYLPDTEVFHNLPFGVISVIFLYFLMFSIFWFWTYRTNLAHRKQEFEKDEKYKAELLTAAKKAEAANEAKTEFLQRMSHDSGFPKALFDLTGNVRTIILSKDSEATKEGTDVYT